MKTRKTTRRCGFQVMPPRGGQHQLDTSSDIVTGVSSHAPARGATVIAQGINQCFNVSSHAPARGATVSVAQQGQNLGGVSSHAPARGATSSKLHSCSNPSSVSSHAPARGATCLVEIISILIVASFKSCPREGGNFYGDSGRAVARSFKSCPREGGNKVRVICLNTAEMFQVMPPRGGQHGVGGWHGFHNSTVSSHAPARGATGARP